MLLRYEYFVRIPPFFKVAKWVVMKSMKFDITKEYLILRTILRGPNEQFYSHNEMSYVFNI